MKKELDKSRTHGMLWWKKRWMSFCSRHFKYDDACNACNAGSWQTNGNKFVSGLVYKISPKVWMWWMNRPNSKARKLIEDNFPNMKKK